MVSLRLWTWAAIVAGAFLGALAALWHGSNPTPDVMAATSRPPSQIERSEQSQSDLRPAPAVYAARHTPIARSASAAGPVRELPLPTSAFALEQVTSSCARGVDDDCLRAAEAFQTGHGVPQDEKRARDFRSTAIKRYAVRCNRRDPDACHALSMLHARGFGLKQDAQAARALLERARLACRTRPAAICARL